MQPEELRTECSEPARCSCAPLHFPAKVCMPRRVYSVQHVVFVLEGCVLARDRYASLALELAGVHCPLHNIALALVVVQKRVHERCLAMIDVSDDGKIPELLCSSRWRLRCAAEQPALRSLRSQCCRRCGSCRKLARSPRQGVCRACCTSTEHTMQDAAKSHPLVPSGRHAGTVERCSKRHKSCRLVQSCEQNLASRQTRWHQVSCKTRLILVHDCLRHGRRGAKCAAATILELAVAPWLVSRRCWGTHKPQTASHHAVHDPFDVTLYFSAQLHAADTMHSHATQGNECLPVAAAMTHNPRPALSSARCTCVLKARQAWRCATHYLKHDSSGVNCPLCHPRICTTVHKILPALPHNCSRAAPPRRAQHCVCAASSAHNWACCALADCV